jgi:hypothetical protein
MIISQRVAVSASPQISFILHLHVLVAVRECAKRKNGSESQQTTAFDLAHQLSLASQVNYDRIFLRSRFLRASNWLFNNSRRCAREALMF